jgi:hypothetical protein
MQQLILEIPDALARRAREGSITPDERDELIEAFTTHCDIEYQIVARDRPIVEEAVALLKCHPLRA